MTDYRTGCFQKHQYSKRDAKRAIKRYRTVKGDRRPGRSPLRPYRCTICGWWHVGSSKLRQVS